MCIKFVILGLKMNYNASIKQYLTDDIAAKTTSLNPHKIIEEVLKDLKKNMETLAYSIDNEPVISSIKSQSFSKSLTAIYILQSSLNFDEGKEIAENLYRIYEFCKDGVMKGFTTYIIDKATSKNCEILCYDINFDNIVFKSEKAKYYNYDISVNYPKLKNKNTFAFWDDHTNHLDRLKFSIENNIKYNVFDDDLGFLNFHSDTWPPIPSISMLKEIKQGFIDKDEIQWICKNKLGKLWVNRFNEMSCLNKVKFHDLFPNLFSITGYKNHSQCSFLIKK